MNHWVTKGSQPDCQIQGGPIPIIKDFDEGIAPSNTVQHKKVLSDIRVLKLKRRVLIHEQRSAGDWKQRQRPKAAAAEDRAVTGTDESQHRLDYTASPGLFQSYVENVQHIKTLR